MQATPIVDTAPVIEPTPVMQATPIVEPTPIVENTPVAENPISVQQPIVEPTIEAAPINNVFDNNQQISNTAQAVVTQETPVSIPADTMLESTPAPIIENPVAQSATPQELDPINSTTVAEPVDNSKDKKKKKKDPKTPKVPGEKKRLNINLIIIIVGIVLILGTAGYFVMTKLVINPKTVVNTAVNETFAKMNQIVNDMKKDQLIFDIQNNTVRTDTNIKFETTTPLLESFDGQEISLKMGADVKNKKLIMYGALGDEPNGLYLKSSASVKDNSIYVDLIDMFDKLIKVENEEPIDWDNINLGITTFDDLNYILTKLPSYINSALEKNGYSETKGTIKFKGKEYKTTNYNFEFNEKKFNTLIFNILTSINSDTTFKQHLANLSQMSFEDFDKSLLKTLKEFTISEDKEYSEEKIIFSLITRDFKKIFTGFSITEKENKKIVEHIIINNNYKTTILTDNDVTTTIEGVANTNKLSGVVKTTNDTTFLIDFNYNKVGTNNTISLIMKDSKMNLSINASITNELKGNEQTSTITTEVNMTQDDNTLNFKVTLNNTISKDVKIGNINVEDSIDISQLTEEDYYNIKYNLKNNIKGTAIENFMSNILSDEETTPNNPELDEDKNPNSF